MLIHLLPEHFQFSKSAAPPHGFLKVMILIYAPLQHPQPALLPLAWPRPGFVNFVDTQTNVVHLRRKLMCE